MVRDEGVPPGVKLNDPDLLVLAAEVERLALAGLPGMVGHALAHPVLAAQTARELLHLPRLDLPLTTGPAGEVIARRLSTRSYGVRRHLWGAAVLEVPEDPERALLGRARRGLRAKVRRAQDLGIRTSLVTGDDSRAATTRIEAARHRAGVAVGVDTWPVPAATATHLLAHGPDGEPLGEFRFVQDDTVALLKTLHAIPGHPLSSLARNAVHDAGLRHLARRGVRHLIGDSALVVTPGVREFMHQCGYRAWNLHLERWRT